MDNIIEKIRNHKELKGEYKVENTPVKVIGIGGKALKVLVFESSKFTSKPIWKQHWINFKDDSEKEFTRKLYHEMLKQYLIYFTLSGPSHPAYAPLQRTNVAPKLLVDKILNSSQNTEIALSSHPVFDVFLASYRKKFFGTGY